ncbi:MAG: Trm112 family protein [Candidatus ainarchaeum sp.]|nr:Trm112 family protein [Candidatus ainarchaeum sp.]
MAVPKKLLKIIACPKCKNDVKERGLFLICESCELAFPVLDKTIPDMLIADVWPLKKAAEARFRHNIKI